MSNFETVLTCLLIPASYGLTYIAGKYDILDDLIEWLKEITEKKS